MYCLFIILKERNFRFEYKFSSKLLFRVKEIVLTEKKCQYNEKKNIPRFRQTIILKRL